jgi:acetoacetyl-CoA synthetase
MSKLLLWKPSRELIKNANITHFQEFVNNEFSLNLESYRQLYEWSIQDISDFWVSIWKFVRIIASENYNVVVEDLNKFPGTKWFVGAKLC